MKTEEKTPIQTDLGRTTLGLKFRGLIVAHCRHAALGHLA